MPKWGAEVLLVGELLNIVKQGVVFPDEDLEKDSVELKKYDEGKKAFLAGVRVMAEAILPKLSLSSKKVTVTLITDEEVNNG